MNTQVNIKNKRARFEYLILDTYIAGMRLMGTEIKSIRGGKISLDDSFCAFIDGQLYLRNMHIAEYAYGSYYNHEAKRDRILLLKKKELHKIKLKGDEKGFSIIPLRIFLNERGWAKVEIGIGQGKKLHDKRESIKERESKVELGRLMKK